MKWKKWVSALLIFAFLFGSALPVHADVLSTQASDNYEEEEALTPFKINKNRMTFNAKNRPYSADTICNDPDNTSSYIKKAVSSNKKVAIVKMSVNSGYEKYNCAVVYPQKAGKATITVTDNLGRTAKVKVTISKAWKKKNFKFAAWVGGVGRTGKIVHLAGQPGSKVTFKIGDQTYRKKIKKNGTAEIKLKGSSRKVGKKYKAVFKKGKWKKTIKGKVYSNTYASFGKIWSCQYDVPVKVYNPAKGDKVTLYAGGKAYHRTIYSTASPYSTTFYTDYKLGNYNTLRIVVRTKAGRKLYDKTWNIKWGS